MEKDNLKRQIKEFLKRAISGESQQKKDIVDIQKEYKEFEVEMSFGKGIFAKKPWFAFLKDDNAVSNGIYPVIAYFKDKNKLVIGKGVSDENESSLKWIKKDSDKAWNILTEGDVNPKCKKCFYRKVYNIASVDQLTDNILDEIIFTLDDIMKDYEASVYVEAADQSSIIKVSNIILYGPPGVGKTYSLKGLIEEIERGVSFKTPLDSLKAGELSSDVAVWEEMKDRVAFITFHQSFGYEDFIEGFRPSEEGEIELADGVFKELASRAKENLKRSKEGSTFDLDLFLNDFAQEVESVDNYKIGQGITISVNRKSDGSFRSFSTQGRVKNQSLTRSIIERDFEKFLNGVISSYQDIRPTYESQSQYHGNAPYYFKLFEKMKEYLGEDGKEKYQSQKEELKKHYLVIDEINRGNISKIFGELITLIEEDKRDNYEVTLPYSKERFSVPSNLYIIGTMNTADKSIALIDVALRRRFTFVKMEPNADLIEDDIARELFVKLNELLRERLGEEKMIGHSYFMGEDLDLGFVIDYKIRPLMEEYFYGDSEGLEVVEEILKSYR